MYRSRPVRVLVVLLAALAPAPAAHAAGWLTTRTLSDGASASNATLATTPPGVTVAAWLRSDGTNQRVQYSLHQAGMPFSAPLDVSTAGVDAQPPALATAPDGRIIIAWEEPAGLHARIVVPGDPSVRATTPLAFPAGSVADQLVRPAATFQGDGSAAIVYTTREGESASLHVATLGSGSLTLAAASAPTDAGTGSPERSVRFSSLSAVSAHGTARFAWEHTEDVSVADTHTTTWDIYSAALGDAKAPLDSEAVFASDSHGTSSDQFMTSVGMASNAFGDVLVAWGRGTSTPGSSVINARVTGPGSALIGLFPFQLAAGLTLESISVVSPGIGKDGVAVVAWNGRDGSANVVQAVSRPPIVLPFSGTLTISGPGAQPGPPAVAISANGDAAVAWSDGLDDNASPRRFQAALRNTDGTFTAPADASGAIAALSDPVAAFAGEDLVLGGTGADPGAGNRFVRAAVLDRTAPTLSGVAFPAGGAAGTPLAFAAQAADAWGPVALSWAFGDGVAGAGPAVQHAYVGPGVFGATVTAADAAGNTRSAAQSLTISAGPSGPSRSSGPAPRVTRAAFSPARFRVARTATAITGAARHRPKPPPRGSTLRLTTNTGGTLKVTITRSVVRHGRACGKRAKRTARCARSVTVGRLTRREPVPGAQRISFSGRLGKKALAPRRYHAVLVLSDGARRGSKPATVRFTVVKG